MYTCMCRYTTACEELYLDLDEAYNKTCCYHGNIVYSIHVFYCIANAHKCCSKHCMVAVAFEINYDNGHYGHDI